jgi:hypothetical protein
MHACYGATVTRARAYYDMNHMMQQKRFTMQKVDMFLSRFLNLSNAKDA